MLNDSIVWAGCREITATSPTTIVAHLRYSVHSIEEDCIFSGSSFSTRQRIYYEQNINSS